MNQRTVVAEAFVVAPELVGRPLAAPWRRLAAMAVDGLAVALLSSLPALVLGVSLSALLARLAWRRRESRSTTARALALAAAAVLALACVLTWARSDGPVVQVGAGEARVNVRPGAVLGFVGQLVALQAADTDEEIASRARELVERVRETAPGPGDAERILRELGPELQDPRARAALAAAAASSAGATGPASLAAAEVALVKRHAGLLETDAAAAAALRPQVARIIAAPELAAATADLRHARRQADVLAHRFAVATSPRGVRGMLSGLADDLGLRVGWGIVYFTALMAWWRGRTLGKRLLGCRVVRIDGRPLTWWNAFNRAGGYAASAVIGLLGFAELLWDPNRQALHDKVASTIVLRE